MKIFLADDHQIFKDSLRLLLDLEGDIEVVGEASGGEQVIESLKTVVPDLILMDISMQGMGGIEATQAVKKAYPEIKVLMLTMNMERHHIVSALEAGVDGYVIKSAGKNEVLRAIRAVNEDSGYFSKQVSSEIVQQLSDHNKPRKNKENEMLSEREIEVLTLIAREFSSAEIAEKLYISVRTVDSHRRNMLEKLGLKNTAGLVRHAIEHGFVQFACLLVGIFT